MVNKRVLNAVLGYSLKNDRMISVHFQGKPFNITILQVYAPTSNAEEAEVEWFSEDLQDLLELTPKKDVLFIIGDWNAKVGSQETPGVTGKFGLGIWNETGQKLIEFCQENALVIANTLFQQHRRRLYTWTSLEIVNTEIRLIIFFAAKDREALYSHQRQVWELTVAQIMNSLLPNSEEDYDCTIIYRCRFWLWITHCCVILPTFIYILPSHWNLSIYIAKNLYCFYIIHCFFKIYHDSQK